MSICRGRGRVWALAWAVIQLAVAPALSLIDGAYAKRDNAVALAHVEGHSTKSCQPPHSADCALCQFVSSHAARVSTAPKLHWPAKATPCVGALTSVFSQWSTLELPASRAPPSA